MGKFDKLDTRLRELEANFLTEFESVKRDPSHPWHKKKATDKSSQNLLRLEKEIRALRNKLMLEPFVIPSLKPDDGERQRSDIKVSSIPRDYEFAINEQEVKNYHRLMIERKLPIFDFVHFSSPKAEIEQEQVLHAKFNPQTGNAQLNIYPTPKGFIDPYSQNIFVNTIFKQILTFQIEVREDAQQYKRSHQQAYVYWMDTWFRTIPENLPLALEI